nr:hypothetical protein [Tanacetum cinerariifolium]
MYPKRSEGEESEYPFFEGDGSFYDELGYYGVYPNRKLDHKEGNENDFKDDTISEFPGYTSSKKEEENEVSEKKGSKEASKMRSNSKPPGYAKINNKVELDLESTARSEPKCKEMKDTCDSGV